MRASPRETASSGLDDELARLECLLPVLLGHLAVELGGVAAELAEHEQREEGHAAQQQHGLDDLHPGGRQHAPEEHVGQHDRAHDQDRRPRTACRTSA